MQKRRTSGKDPGSRAALFEAKTWAQTRLKSKSIPPKGGLPPGAGLRALCRRGYGPSGRFCTNRPLSRRLRGNPSPGEAQRLRLSRLPGTSALPQQEEAEECRRLSANRPWAAQPLGDLEAAPASEAVDFLGREGRHGSAPKVGGRGWGRGEPLRPGGSGPTLGGPGRRRLVGENPAGGGRTAGSSLPPQATEPSAN